MHSNFQVVVHSFFKFGILATICRLKLHMYDAFVQKKLHWGQFQKEERTSEPDSFLVVCFFSCRWKEEES